MRFVLSQRASSLCFAAAASSSEQICNRETAQSAVPCDAHCDSLLESGRDEVAQELCACSCKEAKGSGIVAHLCSVAQEPCHCAFHLLQLQRGLRCEAFVLPDSILDLSELRVHHLHEDTALNDM